MSVSVPDPTPSDLRIYAAGWQSGFGSAMSSALDERTPQAILDRIGEIAASTWDRIEADPVTMLAISVAIESARQAEDGATLHGSESLVVRIQDL